jgi:dTDP-4-dehydrorhamnose 3,5-epimerase
VVLSESADFVYKTTAYYAPESDRGIAWNDPQIGIAWPDLGMDWLLSEKDLKQPLLQDADTFIG